MNTSQATPPPGMASAANVAVKPLTKLHLRENTSKNWKTYKQQWQNYAIVANLHTQPEEYQVTLFLNCLGTDALHVYNGLSFTTEEDKKKLSKIMEKLDKFVIGQVNQTYERYVFNSRDQEADESIDSWQHYASQRKLVIYAHAGTIVLSGTESYLGVRSKQLRKRFLRERKLTLSKCIDICQSTEATSSQLQAISGTETEDVNKIQHRDPRDKTRKIDKTRGPKGC